MDKVFTVELASGKKRYCELELPASPYELLDALEKLQMKPGETPRWEIIQHTSFQFLHVHLNGECDLYQLNALATRLGQMSSSDRIAFEGLFNQEVAKMYADNRISLFSAQWGKCAVTGKEFNNTREIHCHHIIPRNAGGSDKYANLMLVLENVHKLIHATREETIDRYKTFLDLDAEQMVKLNDLRSKAGLAKIAI